MKKYKLSLLVITVSLVVASVASAISVNYSLDKVSNADCDHVGYHYDAKECTCTEAGNKEFWACCKCQTQYLTKPEGTWTDNTLKDALATTHIAYEAPEHHFGVDGNCVHSCGTTFAARYDLGVGKTVITPKTLGLEDAYQLPQNDHKFITYNFKDEKNFEILLDFSYVTPLAGDDTNFLVYLFNGGNENGAVFRMNTSRVEDDGIALTYIYKGDQSITGDLAASAGDGFFYFPRKSQIKSTNEHNYAVIGAELVDAATCKYNLTFRAGNSLDNLWYCTSNPEAQTDEAKVFSVTFGANYNTTNPKLRFTNCSNGATSGTQHDVYFYHPTAASRVINYVCEGNQFGSKSYGSDDVIALPEIRKTGYKFIGWYTSEGEKASDVLSNGYYNLYARFAKTADRNAKTLGDYGVPLYTIDKKGEFEVLNFKGDASTTRIDLNFIYTPTMVMEGDNYAVMGLPYDFIDGQTRIYNRLQLNNKVLAGYMYGDGTTIGGASGNNFNDTTFSMVDGRNYLITLSFELTSATGFDFKNTFEITDLSNGKFYTISKTGTFNGGSSRPFSFADERLTKFVVWMNGYDAGAKATFTTAW